MPNVLHLHFGIAPFEVEIYHADTEEPTSKMPKYRNISIQLHSDTTDGKVPEIPITKASPKLTLSAPVILELAPPSAAHHSPTECLTPLLQDDDKGQISVYVPIIPKALFWISYSIEPPPTDGSFFVFKLLINRQEVVTWSCDVENKFKGKTMFGLFDTNAEADGQAMQKRVFQFGSNDTRIVGDLTGEREEDRFLEVRVFRAKTKRRIGPAGHNYVPLNGQGLELVNAGLLRAQAPQRYYKFRLLDPVDEPHATFRFYYRTWDEIDQLGLHMGQVDTDDRVLFPSANEVDSTPTSDADQLYSRSIPSNPASSMMNPSSMQHTHSPSIISGQYLGGQVKPYAVGDAQFYHPGASLNGQRLQPPYHADTYQQFYHPQPVIPPPYNPGQQQSGYGGGTWPLRGHPLNALNTNGRAASVAPSIQMHSNFSTSLNQLSIPPHLLLQPLLANRPLPPLPSEIANREIDAAMDMARQVNTPSTTPPISGQVEISGTSPSRSPRKLTKKRPELKESFGGFKLFTRRRSQETGNSTSENRWA